MQLLLVLALGVQSILITPWVHQGAFHVLRPEDLRRYTKLYFRRLGWKMKEKIWRVNNHEQLTCLNGVSFAINFNWCCSKSFHRTTYIPWRTFGVQFAWDGWSMHASYKIRAFYYFSIVQNTFMGVSIVTSSSSSDFVIFLYHKVNNTCCMD